MNTLISADETESSFSSPRHLKSLPVFMQFVCASHTVCSKSNSGARNPLCLPVARDAGVFFDANDEVRVNMLVCVGGWKRKRE